jgi:serine/threonine protein kinase
MGAVYAARDLHFPNVFKRVAVKEMVNLARDPSINDRIIRNFEREANILATLDHPSIPRIYDYFSNDQRSYLILEFIDGKDLEAILNESAGFLPEAQVVSWAVEVCDVLSYLHNIKPEPVIFRDIKPSNIMLNTHGHIMLVDFGIAKTFQIGQKGTMIGTEGYSPPEQYKGDSTPLADIYALGATLHHLLTRRDPRLEAPFSFSERMIRSINPAVSLELEAVIYTALQYNPNERFSSTVKMKDALVGAGKDTGLLTDIPAATPASQPESAGATKALWKFECEEEVPLLKTALCILGPTITMFMHFKPPPGNSFGNTQPKAESSVVQQFLKVIFILARKTNAFTVSRDDMAKLSGLTKPTDRSAHLRSYLMVIFLSDRMMPFYMWSLPLAVGAHGGLMLAPLFAPPPWFKSIMSFSAQKLGTCFV